MPELPPVSMSQKTMEFTIAELRSTYIVLRNFVRVNESTKFSPGSTDAHRYLRIKSVVRKIEAHLDAQADHQLRTDAEASEDE